jgi:amino acid permease
MEPFMADPTHDGENLKKGLKQRHLSMIAIGGVIGAGLFVGSGAIIGEVGPPEHSSRTRSPASSSSW